MNSNIDRYLAAVGSAASQALASGNTALSAILPCVVCRELEVPNNQYVDSSDPFMVSYRALRRMQHVAKPAIPRKIEFGSAVYLKEGIIDCIFPDAPVTLVFIGDGNSDKRFAYNCHRLFATFPQPFSVHCFVCNPELTGMPFGTQTVSNGWDDEKLFYHADSWSELDVLANFLAEKYADSRVLVIVDLDGTLLCPRPTHNANIKAARKKAIIWLAENYFDDAFFSSGVIEHVKRIEISYAAAGKTGFSRAYDDEDLTMLIALGLYSGVIESNDPLLNPENNVGFVNPIEWLQYAAFIIGNDRVRDRELRQLRSLYVRCMDALQAGSPTSFVDFRKAEEKVLVEGAAAGMTTISRAVVKFIEFITQLQGVPLGFSDRPNASLGFVSTSSPAYTMVAPEDSVFHVQLQLV